MTDADAALPHRHASEGVVPAANDQVFAHLDDHARLAAHMQSSSWMLGGGRMAVGFDGGRGQVIGSRITMAGRAFGVNLSLEEIVTEREPPSHKAWETRGTPRLLVIGRYRMGFDLAPVQGGSALRVFVEYALPASGAGRWLGRLFGAVYARWCTRRMLDDAIRHFAGKCADAASES
jgi:hypothetical protein